MHRCTRFIPHTVPIFGLSLDGFYPLIKTHMSDPTNVAAVWPYDLCIIYVVLSVNQAEHLVLVDLMKGAMPKENHCNTQRVARHVALQSEVSLRQAPITTRTWGNWRLDPQTCQGSVCGFAPKSEAMPTSTKLPGYIPCSDARQDPMFSICRNHQNHPK
jgi:hypothetical protein